MYTRSSVHGRQGPHAKPHATPGERHSAERQARLSRLALGRCLNAASVEALVHVVTLLQPLADGMCQHLHRCHRLRRGAPEGRSDVCTVNSPM